MSEPVMPDPVTLQHEAIASCRAALLDARLALHIVLDQQLGPLNENQDDLLETVRTGLDAAEADLRQLAESAQPDSTVGRRDTIRVADILRALRPQLDAAAAAAGVTLTVDLAPVAANVRGDRSRLQQAFEMLLTHIVRRASPNSVVRLSTMFDGGVPRVRIEHDVPLVVDANVALARRIFLGNNARLDVSPTGTSVTFEATS